MAAGTNMPEPPISIGGRPHTGLPYVLGSLSSAGRHVVDVSDTWPGPKLGEHNGFMLVVLLGMSNDFLDVMDIQGVSGTEP